MGILVHRVVSKKSLQFIRMREVIPAPVVPPDLLEARTVGDWWIVNSRPRIEMSTSLAFESMNPRFCEGISWENKRKASIVMDEIGINNSKSRL